MAQIMTPQLYIYIYACIYIYIYQSGRTVWCRCAPCPLSPQMAFALSSRFMSFPFCPPWKATKEYLNQRGTKIRVFRVCFRTPFLPPFFPHFSPLFPLQALCILVPPLPSSPPPSSPPFLAPGKVRFRYPSDLGTL